MNTSEDNELFVELYKDSKPSTDADDDTYAE